MNTRHSASRTLTLALLGMLTLAPLSVRAAPPVRIAPSAHIQQTLVAVSWGEWTQSIWSGLASRQAMMRFGAIILVVALVAIWWRRT